MHVSRANQKLVTIITVKPPEGNASQEKGNYSQEDPAGIKNSVSVVCNGVHKTGDKKDDCHKSPSLPNGRHGTDHPSHPNGPLYQINEHFHLNGRENSLEEASSFAGRRNVKDPKGLTEREIVSYKGTVRGFRNRVRAGIATFVDGPKAEKLRNYRQLEKGKIVVYTTSMTVVRKTFEKCKLVRNILQNHMVRYEERDLYMSKEHQRELKERLDEHASIPQVFVDGIHLGGVGELEALNETGELRKIFLNYPRIHNVRTTCSKCGGYRYVPCCVCHGSKKSVHRNHFTEEFCALRCMQCDENGLQRCDLCLDQQE